MATIGSISISAPPRSSDAQIVARGSRARWARSRGAPAERDARAHQPPRLARQLGRWQPQPSGLLELGPRFDQHSKACHGSLARARARAEPGRRREREPTDTLAACLVGAEIVRLLSGVSGEPLDTAYIRLDMTDGTRETCPVPQTPGCPACTRSRAPTARPVEPAAANSHERPGRDV